MLTGCNYLGILTAPVNVSLCVRVCACSNELKEKKSSEVLEELRWRICVALKSMLYLNILLDNMNERTGYSYSIPLLG